MLFLLLPDSARSSLARCTFWNTYHSGFVAPLIFCILNVLLAIATVPELFHLSSVLLCWFCPSFFLPLLEGLSFSASVLARSFGSAPASLVFKSSCLGMFRVILRKIKMVFLVSLASDKWLQRVLLCCHSTGWSMLIHLVGMLHVQCSNGIGTSNYESMLSTDQVYGGEKNEWNN